jgi:hypothetical protein
MEIADVMNVVKAGGQHALSPETEADCGKIAALSDAWAWTVRFSLLSCNEALQSDAVPILAGWTSLAQNAALGGHA